ncbi:MAG: YsnF/AvaK domain-containing protein [Actinomycetota bacterium]|nr:YsnF/AvaK domain-containing protein [Actinomycetota bacterium]
MDIQRAEERLSTDDAIEVVRSEERLRAGVQRVVTRRVLVGKRIVTEERTVNVTVRREELVFEDRPVGSDAGDAGFDTDVRAGSGEPLVEFLLSEEEPVVTVRTVPKERVRVFREWQTSEQQVEAVLGREEIELDEASPRASYSDGDRSVT